MCVRVCGCVWVCGWGRHGRLVVCVSCVFLCLDDYYSCCLLCVVSLGGPKRPSCTCVF